MTKETVFIGHANPEDSVFAGWLSAKLSITGYRVWCDLRSLAGGEQDFWDEIEKTIRERAVKFIFVASHASTQKRGTKRELAVADGLGDFEDFVIPLRIDNLDFRTELPAEIVRAFVIDFRLSWATGLEILLNKLEKDNVPKAEPAPMLEATKFWQDGQRIALSATTDKEERHWSNWFSLELPDTVFASAVVASRNRATGDFMSHSGRSYSFEPLPVEEKSFGLFEEGREDVDRVVSCETEKLVAGELSDYEAKEINTVAARRALIQLCNKAIEGGLQKKGLMIYPRSSGPSVFYVQHPEKIRLSRYGRSYRLMAGSSGSLKWHFGVSVSTSFYPFPHVVFKSHVIFTRGGQPLDERQQHTARRHTCKMWYNEKWRDLLLALALRLSDDPTDESPKMTVEAGTNAKLTVLAEPIACWSVVGYQEPVK